MSKLAAAFLILASVAWARPQAQTIPPGTTIKVELLVKLDSKKSQVGDKVSAKLNQDLKVHGAMIAPKDSLLQGSVTEVVPAAEGQPAKLAVLFNQLIPKNQPAIGVRAAISKMLESQVGFVMMSPELGGGNYSMQDNSKYRGYDRASNGVPIHYAVMEAASGSGPDLGGEIQSVSADISFNKGAHVQVQFLHN